MMNVAQAIAGTWVTEAGEYLLVRTGSQIRLVGVDVISKTKYDILFNAGDSFRDCQGLTITFMKCAYSKVYPSVNYVFGDKPSDWFHEKIEYVGLTIAELAATDKRICRLTPFISLSFRKDRTFTLMFRVKGIRSFS